MLVLTTDRKNVVPANPASPSGPGSAMPEAHGRRWVGDLIALCVRHEWLLSGTGAGVAAWPAGIRC